MYDSDDIPSDSTCVSQGYGDACSGYSFYEDGTNSVTLNASAPEMSIREILGLGMAHELQHLCWKMNGLGLSGYEDINETLSTLAEYFLDSWRPHYYDLSHDAPVIREEKCEPWIRYQTEKIWIVYLYEAFKGAPQDPSDDLVYRWINSGSAPYLSDLAGLIWNESDYSWLGGSNSRERFARLGANYLAAKFCNAPALGAHGEFGIGASNTVREWALFRDNCEWYDSAATPMEPVDCPSNAKPSPGHPVQLYPPGHYGCWNVRVLVPDYELGEGNEDSWAHIDSIYVDGDDGRITPESDGSADYIDVSITGTDYLIFRAGPYFQGNADHCLRVHLRAFPGRVFSSFPESYRIRPVGWLIEYAADEDTLQLHPEAIRSITPLHFSSETIAALDGRGAGGCRGAGVW